MTVGLPGLPWLARRLDAIRPAGDALRGDAPGRACGRSLRSGPFRSVLALSLLGFAIEYLLRAVVPLVVLARGGDAVIVGLLAGVFALPSMVFRPIVGHLADNTPPRTLLRAGTLAAGLLPLLLLLPGVVAAVVVRFLQGTGWSFYSVANQTLMARVAPRHRRGEASALYMTMPALAMLVAPAAGVALFAAGEESAVLVAVGLGLIASLIAWRLPSDPPRSTSPQPAVERGRGLARLVEPSALPGTAMLITFGSATTLFTVFAPVFVTGQGIGLDALIFYYPIYGLAQVLALVLGGRISDQLGRRRSIGLGTAIAAVALAFALSGGMTAFTVAAVVYAIAAGLVNPTVSAMTIERAPRGRIGSAMATYSIGYQIANGLSGILWGLVIGGWGYPWPFVVAIGLQAITLIQSRRLNRAVVA